MEENRFSETSVTPDNQIPTIHRITKTKRESYIFPIRDNDNYDYEQSEDDSEFVDATLANTDVLLFTLVFVLLAQIVILLLNIIDVAVAGGMIPRAIWAAIMLIITFLNIIWCIVFTNTHKKLLRNNQSLRRIYKIFLAFVMIHSIIMSIVIVPVAFVNSIDDPRFREYLSLYALTSGPTILCGFFLGWESTKYT